MRSLAWTGRITRRIGPRAGFVRYEIYLLLALALMAAAVAVPHLVRGEVKAALLALGILVGVVAAVAGVLYLVSGVVWVVQAAAQSGGGRGGAAARGLGHLARFGLFALIGMLLAAGLVANHRLGPGAENLAAAVGGVLAGAGGTLVYLRLGKARFWPGFGLFTLALLGSLAGGILGILLPEPWGIDAGVLAPLLLFLALVLAGRARSRRRGRPAE